MCAPYWSCINSKSKRGGVDSTFGGQSANQMFGAARSADFIEKLTWYLAAALFILCIFAAIMAGTGVEAAAPIIPDAPPPVSKFLYLFIC